MPNRYYDWVYYTPDQIEKERSAKWLSLYVTSSKHITEMERVLEIYRCHRGLLNEDAFTFASHGVLAMHQYMTVDDMRKLKEQIETFIQEKTTNER